MKAFKNKVGLPKQVLKNFSNIESWLKVRTKVKESKCQNCKQLHTVESGLALAFIPGELNAHICNNCADEFIKLGSEDVEAKRKTNSNMKEDLIVEILSLEKFGEYVSREGSRYRTGLESREIEWLTTCRDKKLALKAEHERIEKEIEDNYVDTPTEDYLIKEYEIIEDKKYLKHPDKIEDYFRGGDTMVECGQGEYQDEWQGIVKIGDKFYDVTLTYEIGSAKQDYGDRLYWAEGLESCTYNEIPKPLPRPTQKVTLTGVVTDWQLAGLKAIAEKNGLTLTEG